MEKSSDVKLLGIKRRQTEEEEEEYEVREIKNKINKNKKK